MILTTVFAALLASGPAPSAWWVETCAPRPGAQLVGSGLALQVPKDWTVRPSRSADDECFNLTHQRAAGVIRSCSGPGSSGRPGTRVEGASGVRERWIILPDGASIPDEQGPVDIRGAAPDGTKWRFMGRAGQTIEYADLKPGSEAALDEVLDSLCWRAAQAKR